MAESNQGDATEEAFQGRYGEKETLRNLLASWFLTTDHRRQAFLYLFLIAFLSMTGGILGSLMRAELTVPEGGIVTSDLYARVFTLHGQLMVFFFLLPAVPSVLGNYLVPLMIGARSLAFPRLNLLAWYAFLFGSIGIFWGLLRGGSDSGWTFYLFEPTAGTLNGLLCILGVILSSISLLLTSMNLIVTIHKMRRRGIVWWSLPVFVWAIYIAAIIALLVTPVLLALMTLLGMEWLLGLGLFDPSVGGDPLLYRRLFWLWGRPAFYIIALPCIGIITHVLTSRPKGGLPFGYRVTVFSMFSIAGLGLLVSGSHLYVASQPLYASLVSSFLSYLLAIPFVLILYNWVVELSRVSPYSGSAFYYGLGALGSLLIGGLSGLFLITTGTDVPLHSTHFVLAHFHFMLAGTGVMSFLAGLHFWWPKISGRMLSETIGKVGAGIAFVGVNLAFLPQFLLGLQGMPRRHHNYPPEFEGLNVLASAGLTILIVGYLIPLFHFLWSLRFGPRADPNPMNLDGLEWQSTSAAGTILSDAS